PEFVGAVGPGDSAITFLVVNVSDEVIDATAPPFEPLGIAADNGTPAPGIGVMINYPRVQVRARSESPGYGLSPIIAHEVGHLAGQMHPFNMWDVPFFGGLAGALTAPWLYVSDQSHTTMGYYAEESGFGAFDREVNARSLAASYYGHAFELLSQV